MRIRITKKSRIGRRRKTGKRIKMLKQKGGSPTILVNPLDWRRVYKKEQIDENTCKYTRITNKDDGNSIYSINGIIDSYNADCNFLEHDGQFVSYRTQVP